MEVSPATPARLAVVRAISIKPSGTASLPEVNFALHLQADGDPAHVYEEALITFGEDRAFPESLWPAAEELCRRLPGKDLHQHRIEGLLHDIAEEAAQSLEQQERKELADCLRMALRPKSSIDFVRVLGRLIGSRAYRHRMTCEDKLREMLQIFDAALRELAGRAARKVGRISNHIVEPFYGKHFQGLERACCFPEPPLPRFQGRTANLYTDVAFLRYHPKDGTKGHLLEREALAHGLSVLRFPDGSFIASDRNGRRLNFKWSRSPVSSSVSLALCNHKEATRARLARCGLPVARGSIFASGDHGQITAYAARIGYPVVCKPAVGVRGIGVIANIQDEEELHEALKLYAGSALGTDDLVIEQHVSGTDYRIVVVGGKVVSVVYREAASIVGTGIHTIADLVLHKNSIRLRNPHLRRRCIQIDESARYQLGRACLTLDSIPEEGRRIQLANANNISRGGDSIEILDELHTSIKDVAIKASEAIPDMGFCGMDVILEDHTKPIDEQVAAIIEINAHGAIGTGQYPMWGTPRNVARHFLLYCAEREGLEVSQSPAARLSVKLKARGKVTGVGYRRWFMRRAHEFGLIGRVTNVDRVTVQATLEGDTAPVAALVNAAVRGPRRAIPVWVAAEHIPPQGDIVFGERPASTSWKAYMRQLLLHRHHECRVECFASGQLGQRAGKCDSFASPKQCSSKLNAGVGDGLARGLAGNYASVT
jgi:D-alanine-D-alanine ligase-like ATP-grasp enzyme/acylphosphatase